MRNAEALKVKDMEVFTYENKYQPDDFPEKEYVWKENDIYYHAFFFGEIKNQDQILEKLISEK